MALPLLALAPAAIGAAGGIASYIAGEGAYDASRAALENWEMLPLEQRIANYEMLKQQGELNPKLEAEILTKDTELANIVTDPRARQARIEALTSMSRMGREGLLLSEQAELAKLREETAAQRRGAEGAITAQMQARGTMGGGDELAMRMAQAQNQAAQQSQADRDIMAQAQGRRLQAILQSGNMAGQMEEQDYNRQANLASTRDRFQLFDIQNRAGVQQRNVGAKNVAQQMNLAEKQRIADTNVALRNRQEDQRIAALQAMADERNARASGLADISRRQTQDRAKAIGGIFSGAASGASAALPYMTGGAAKKPASFASVYGSSGLTQDEEDKFGRTS